MNINSSLNLILPVKWSEKLDDNGNLVPLVTAYHIPISQEVFDQNWRIIAATRADLVGIGDMGPKVAANALRDAGAKYAATYGLEKNPADMFLAELNRLTTILAPGDTGVIPTPVDVAIKRGVLEPEEWDEAVSSLTFFTSALSAAIRPRRRAVAEHFASVLMGSITSSPLMEYAGSLKKSTPAETSAEVAEPGDSLVPS